MLLNFLKVTLLLSIVSIFSDTSLAQRVFVTKDSVPDWRFNDERVLFIKRTKDGFVGEIQNLVSKTRVATTKTISRNPIKVRRIANTEDILLLTSPDVSGALEWAACLSKGGVPGYFCGRVRRPEIFRLSPEGDLNKIYTHHSGVFGYFVDAILRINGDLILLYSTKKGLQLDLIDNRKNVIWSKYVTKAKAGALFEKSNQISVLSAELDKRSQPLYHWALDENGNVISKKSTQLIGNGAGNFGTPSYAVLHENNSNLVVHSPGDRLSKRNALSLLYFTDDEEVQRRTFSWQELFATGMSCPPEVSLSNGFIAVGCKTRTKELGAKFLIGRFKNGNFHSKVVELAPPCNISAALKWSEIDITQQEDQKFLIQWVAYTRDSHDDREPKSCASTKTLNLEEFKIPNIAQ